jgi:hypothetical protein
MGYRGFLDANVLVPPMDVFTGAAGVVDRCRPGDATAYRVEVVSTAGGPVRTESGLTLDTGALPDGDDPIGTCSWSAAWGSTRRAATSA